MAARRTDKRNCRIMMRNSIVIATVRKTRKLFLNGSGEEGQRRTRLRLGPRESSARHRRKPPSAR
jgi:hypothetical protein